MSFAAILSILGWALGTFAAAMLLPILVALGYGETAASAVFVGSALLTLFVGGGLVMATRGAAKDISRRDGFILAALGWALLPVFGALPFYFTGVVESGADAYFEALSGLTTTGATVLSGLEELPRSILFWRALMQWLGGLAAILLAVAILSILGIGGLSLYRSAIPRGEGDSMIERLLHAVGSIWRIYAGLTLLCAVALWAAGMPAFDAVCHAFSVLSTGGFSTRDGSVGAFESPAIELVVVVFMIVAAVNFTLHWAAARGRLRAYREDPEFRYFVLLALAVAAVAALALMALSGFRAADALRQGLFAAVSGLTTSGFLISEIDIAYYGLSPWPTLLSMLILIMILIGGCTGSTAGGIKLMRLVILFKQGGRELRRLAHPHGVFSFRYGGGRVDASALRGVWSYFMVFVACFAGLSLAIAASGVEFRTAVAAAAGAISNAGPAMAYVAGGGTDVYADLPISARWCVALGMLLGRVELFALLTLLNPAFWRR